MSVAYRTKFLGTLRWDGGDMSMVAQPLRGLPKLVFCVNFQKSVAYSMNCQKYVVHFTGSGSSCNGCETIGMPQPSQRDMPIN
jgi:hypothetical protein